MSRGDEFEMFLDRAIPWMLGAAMLLLFVAVLLGLLGVIPWEAS